MMTPADWQLLAQVYSQHTFEMIGLFSGVISGFLMMIIIRV